MRNENPIVIEDREVLSTPTYNWLILVFGEAQGKALPSPVVQAFDIRRRVRDAVARGETQHGHTWLF
jgi:hypothetical protein